MQIPRLRLSAVAAAALPTLVACAPRTGPVTGPVSVPGIRVVETASGRTIGFDAMVERLGDADVVFFGEQHDDPETHRTELGILDAIGRLGRPVVLSLEMFERDVQGVLDDYLAGRIPEPEFLAASRPWDRYVTDYRPMVELAKARGWRVVAANVPRPMASAVGRKALAALDTLTPTERGWAARDIQCPDDAYRARFMEDMKGHGAGGAAPSAGDTLPTAIAERFYFAQCVKDETMAESIVHALERAPANAIVVHYDGAFHSDYRQGTVARVARRAPGRTLRVVTALPVTDPVAAPATGHADRADYLVYTRQPRLHPPTSR